MNQPSNVSSENSLNADNTSKHPKDEAARALKSSVAAEVHDLSHQAKHVATDMAAQAKQSAQTKISNSKERAADSLGNVANVLRQTGEKLRAEDDSGLTEYVVRAADHVESASSYLKDRNFTDIVGDVGAFARREPALFLGGAFALGLVGGRFLKSSRAPASAREEITNQSRQGVSDVSPTQASTAGYSNG